MPPLTLRRFADLRTTWARRSNSLHGKALAVVHSPLIEREAGSRPHVDLIPVVIVV